MEIIGKIAVKRNRKQRAKKTGITIGLVAFALTMLCELLLENFSFLALIVPFLYLFNLRNKMGKNVLYKDVLISVTENECEKNIEISNCEYRNKDLYSARYSVTKDSTISILYFLQKEELKISCSARKVLFLGNTIIPIFEKRPCEIKFYVSLEDAQKIASELKCFLNVRC